MRPLRPIGPINAPPFAQPRHHSAPIILPTPQALSQPVTWFVFPGGGERAKAPTCLTKPAARPNLPPRLGSPAQPGPPQDQFNGPNSTEPWPDDVTKDQVVIELNTDFSTKTERPRGDGGRGCLAEWCAEPELHAGHLPPGRITPGRAIQ